MPTFDGNDWPPNYDEVYDWRMVQLERMARDKRVAGRAMEYYKDRPAQFITQWVDTYDPRNSGRPGKLVKPPLILFPRQRELVHYLHWCVTNQRSGLIEKSRDMGATWVCSAFSVHVWLFSRGASVGWGSRKEMLVDRQGDPDSIFEKIRLILRQLPSYFMPENFNWNTHSNYMRIINPENGATITGESGDNIGRGGRKLVYFKDESAHYEHPESIEAALADNTNVQIDLSSVNGVGNIFQRRRESGVDWAPGAEVPLGKTVVFVMDWRDHPEKNDAWYNARRRKMEGEGLLHLFHQEVDRNYASAVDGLVLPPEWVTAAIDAHTKLGVSMDDGNWHGALDVADSGSDLSALTFRKGVILKTAEDWGKRDTTYTTQKALRACQGKGSVTVDYDCIGVGAGVKGEYNRIQREMEEDAEMERIFRSVKFVDWNAGASPQKPEDHVVKGDPNSPLNKDFYYNLKAQGWWLLRRRFERTFKAVTEGYTYDPDELISLDSKTLGAKLPQIRKELSQPTMGYTAGKNKLIINKSPEGVRSPNLADSVMMNYHPIRKYSYDTSMNWVDDGT